MEYVKFKFVNPEDERKVFIALIRQSKVVVVKDGDTEAFIVPKKSLAVLDQKEIHYEVLAELGYDGVIQALRSSLTSQIQ